jgi:hypothetical protein
MTDNQDAEAIAGFSCCCIGFSLVLITIGGVSYGMGYHKEANLFENVCLVVDAQAVLHTCGSADEETSTPYAVSSENMKLIVHENIKGYYICYEAVWTVEYNSTTVAAYSNRKRARISGSYSEDYVDAMDELDKYPVSIKHCTFYLSYAHRLLFFVHRLIHHKRATLTNVQIIMLFNGQSPIINVV